MRCLQRDPHQDPAPRSAATTCRAASSPSVGPIGSARLDCAARIVPGSSAANITAASWQLDDGSLQDLTFDVPIEQSSWVALRIYPSSHTNPVFIKVGGKPIRASKKSAQWCADSVDQCWKKKSPHIREEELTDAKQAFDQAKAIYLDRLKECVVE